MNLYIGKRALHYIINNILSYLILSLYEQDSDYEKDGGDYEKDSGDYEKDGDDYEKNGGDYETTIL